MLCLHCSHTPTYITCELRPHRVYLLCQSGPYIRRICQPLSMASRPAGSVDLPTTPIELDDYWFPTKLCVCVCKRERERECPCGCVCVAFVILAILMSLKTISEKVANDVRAKMELEVFRVFMHFVAAAWTISPTTNNEQQRKHTINENNNKNNNDNGDCYHSYNNDVWHGMARRGNKKLWHFQLNCKINFHQKLAYFHIC